MEPLEETHLDLLLKGARRRTLEERFVEDKAVFLRAKLASLQEAIDRQGINQDIGFLAMVLYTFDLIEREVGPKHADRILASLAFTSWSLDRYRGLLGLGFDEKVGAAVSTFLEGERERIRPDAGPYVGEMVRKAWAEMGLDRDQEKEFSALVGEKRRLYTGIGSGPDMERRELVQGLARRGGLRLLNIGIIPTELCPNACRFCLAPWKAGAEERNRELGDGSFRRIADQVIALAGEEGLVLTITGGEPFLEPERVLYILKNARSRVELTTSGFWARDRERTRATLSRISDAARANKNPGFSLGLQVSLDAFHQEVVPSEGGLEERIPLANVANIVELTRPMDMDLCLLTKYTLYLDPLVNLLAELEARGLRGKIVGRHYDPELKVTMPLGTAMVTRPALLKAYLELPAGRPVFILYTAVEAIGSAALLEPFEYPAFRRRTEEFMAGSSRERLPLTGIEVGDDGNVYPGAHALYSWSLGNVLQEDLRSIYDRIARDPLIAAMGEDPKRIIDMALEQEPGLLEEMSATSSPL
ncbi:MAG: radical SAM protein, partial [Candidatus Hydrothermarchaeota archaeon]